MKQVVQNLQLALEKEKTKVKDLKEQVRALYCTGCVLVELKYQLHIIFAFQIILRSII